MKFNTVKLGEYLYIKGRIGWKGLKKKEYLEKSGFRIVNGESLTENGIDWNKAGYISKERYDESPEIMLQQDDILISKDGTIGKIGYVDSLDTPTTVASGIFVIRNQMPEIINTRFIYHFFNSKYFKNFIIMRTEGSVIPHLYQKDFVDLDFPMPELRVQDKIVGILDAINNKIKINKSINNNLLEQIKTICTAWLSDYKPFDGVMPSDWEEKPLSDIAEFISGYSYKGTELNDSTIAMATIKNFERKGGFKLDGYKEIIPSSKLKESQHAELFDTLVAHTDLTQNAEVIGNAEPIMSKSGYDDIVFSMDLVKVLPKKNGVSKFLIAAILQDKKFKAHCLGYVNGTTVLHLSKKALPEYKLFLPSDFSTLKPLDEVVTALYKQVSSNISENTYLEELRESLLPKLMSGELDISNIDL